MKSLVKDDAIDFLKSVLIGFIIAFLISLVFKPIKVVGESMDNTLHDGQRLFVFRQAYLLDKTPEYKDIVVVDADFFGDKKKIIKRVIATEGQSLEILNGEVYVNSKKLNESYIKEPMDTKWDMKIDSIPENKIFVMGDNRNNSGDSRQIGLIDESDIYGKVLMNK